MRHRTAVFRCQKVRHNFLSKKTTLHAWSLFNITLCRCAEEFKAVIKYSIFAFFLCGLLCQCSILLTLEFQLVECACALMVFWIWENINLKMHSISKSWMTMPNRLILRWRPYWFSGLFYTFFWCVSLVNGLPISLMYLAKSWNDAIGMCYQFNCNECIWYSCPTLSKKKLLHATET